MAKTLEEEFKEKFGWAGSSGTYQGVRDEGILQFVLQKVSEAKQEERALCRQVFIEEVDWAEWDMSDEDAGERFDEEIAARTTTSN